MYNDYFWRNWSEMQKTSFAWCSTFNWINIQTKVLIQPDDRTWVKGSNGWPTSAELDRLSILQHGVHPALLAHADGGLYVGPDLGVDGLGQGQALIDHIATSDLLTPPLGVVVEEVTQGFWICQPGKAEVTVYALKVVWHICKTSLGGGGGLEKK